MNIGQNHSRRAFLQSAALLGCTGAAAPLASSLGLIGEAASAAATSDYKALVCVFLYGGNDYANTLPPYDAASYNKYLAARPSLALHHDALTATALRPDNDLGGRQYALNPAMSPMLDLFDAGVLAPVLNIGNLVQPITKQQYLNRSALVPPKLFSHNDQASFMQASQPEGADSGWGGRMGDLVRGSNGTAALTSISVNGNALFLSGQNTTPFTVSPGKIQEMLYGNKSVYGSHGCYQAFRQLITQQSGCFFAQEYGKVASRTLEVGEAVAKALESMPEEGFTTFPAGDDGLAAQLKMAARLIAVGPSLGLKRQVFFVGMGGWDTHNGLADKHPKLLAALARALRSFYQATVQLGVERNVTTFTASDFGRTLGENNDGSDHGWGGMQFVLGGDVAGRAIYGKPPEVGLGTNDDVDAGRLIPTTSQDQLAATLASWFGVGAGDLPSVMPNLRYYDQSAWNMGLFKA